MTRQRIIASLLCLTFLFAASGPVAGAAETMTDVELASITGGEDDNSAAACALALVGVGISVLTIGAGFIGALGFSFAAHSAALACI